MTKFAKKALCLSLSMLMISTMAISSFAITESYLDGAPVIGSFIYDEEMAAIIAEKEANMLSSPQARATARLLDIDQVPQERYNWCGYAAIKSILDSVNVSKTQTEIATDIRGANNIDSSCPWLWSHGDTIDQFPVPNYLNEEITANAETFLYIPYPFGNAGATILSAEDVKTRVMSTVDSGRGVLSCGDSRGDLGGHVSILPGYPARRVGHWIVIRGYLSNGDKVYIADPAKSDAVSFSDDISAYYTITTETLAAYASAKGIVW